MLESNLTETLDRRGQLDDANGPGCYALEVAVSQNAETVARQWHRHHDTAPTESFYARLADAKTVLYVGAASNVYDRLCDHCGDVRKAVFLEAFPPAELHSLWPQPDRLTAFHAEYNVANRLSDATTRVWTDGRLL